MTFLLLDLCELKILQLALCSDVMSCFHGRTILQAQHRNRVVAIRHAFLKLELKLTSPLNNIPLFFIFAFLN